MGRHSRPVHFNRGRHGHVWICCNCGMQLLGLKLPDEEREALIEFVKFSDTPSELKARQARKEKVDMSIKLGLPVKDTLTNVRGVAMARFEYIDGRVLIEIQPPVNKDNVLPAAVFAFEKNCSNVKALAAPKSAEEILKSAVETEEAEANDEPRDMGDVAAPAPSAEDEDFGTKPKTKAKKGSSFDEDDAPSQPKAAAQTDEDDFGAETKKTKTKAKTYSKADLNDACKARARAIGKDGVAKVKAILVKNFKTESVSEIPVEKYGEAIKILTGEE